MLGEVELDAVAMATPHQLHAPMGLACLEAGLHAFIEKPIANTVSDADRLVEAAETRNLQLGIGHNYRTFPGNLAMKRQVDALGDIHRVLWQWIDTRAESYYARDIWRSKWAQAGGGVLLNQTSHDLDLLCWMLGEPVEVSAMIGNWGHAFEVEDTAVANIRFKNGALANVQLSICDRALNYRQVSGDRGTIEFRDDGQPNSIIPDTLRVGRYQTPMRAYIEGGEGIASTPEIVWEDVDVAGEGRIPPIMGNFIGAIHGEETLVTSGPSARVTIELINAIIMSGMTAEAVSLPIDRGDYDALYTELIDGKKQVQRLS